MQAGMIPEEQQKAGGGGRATAHRVWGGGRKKGSTNNSEPDLTWAFGKLKDHSPITALPTSTHLLILL